MNYKKKCAVIVTYNRKSDLLICISKLLKQSVTLDEILIIDNASTDGTYDLLIKNKIVNLKNKKNDGVLLSKINETDVIYSKLPVNTGGAGGFFEGQKLALERGNHYIWLMDDDGFAEEDTLELLLNSLTSTCIDVINPLVIDIEKPDKLSFGLSLLIKNTAEAEEKKDTDGIIYDLCNPFNGTLFTADIIKKIGFIKAEMFIWGDETEYMRRLVSAGYRIGTNVNAKFYHPTSKTVIESFFFNKYQIERKPLHLQMNFYRNKAYLCSKYSSGLRRFKAPIIDVLYFTLKMQPKNVFNYIRYYADGYFDIYKLPPIID